MSISLRDYQLEAVQSVIDEARAQGFEVMMIDEAYIKEIKRKGG